MCCRTESSVCMQIPMSLNKHCKNIFSVYSWNKSNIKVSFIKGKTIAFKFVALAFQFMSKDCCFKCNGKISSVRHWCNGEVVCCNTNIKMSSHISLHVEVPRPQLHLVLYLHIPEIQSQCKPPPDVV